MDTSQRDDIGGRDQACVVLTDEPGGIGMRISYMHPSITGFVSVGSTAQMYGPFDNGETYDVGPDGVGRDILPLDDELLEMFKKAEGPIIVIAAEGAEQAQEEFTELVPEDEYDFREHLDRGEGHGNAF